MITIVSDDFNRVKLSGHNSHGEHSDYINASHITEVTTHLTQQDVSVMIALHELINGLSVINDTILICNYRMILKRMQSS